MGREGVINWPARKSSTIQHTRSGQRRDATRTGHPFELDSVDVAPYARVRPVCIFTDRTVRAVRVRDVERTRIVLADDILLRRRGTVRSRSTEKQQRKQEHLPHGVATKLAATAS